MDSQHGSRLPTPARSQGSVLSTSSHPSMDAHRPATTTQELGSVPPPSRVGSASRGDAYSRRSRSVTSFPNTSLTLQPNDGHGAPLEPLDDGELLLSNLPVPPRSDAHIPHSLPSFGASAPRNDPYFYGRALRGYTASVPASAMNADPIRSFGEGNYTRSDVSSTSGTFLSAEARAEAQSFAPSGGSLPATPAPGFDNVTHRYRPRFSTFRRALNEGNGGYGLRAVPQTTPARLQPLPEEGGAFQHPDSDPGRYGPMRATANVAAWTEDVHYTSMHAGFPATNDVDSYPTDYVHTREVPFDTQPYAGDVSMTERMSLSRGHGSEVDGDRIGEISRGFTSFYISEGTRHADPAGFPSPSSQTTLYSPSVLFDKQSVKHPQVMGPPPILQQPQPSRPFVMPEPPRPHSSRPLPQPPVPAAAFSASPTAQSGPQLVRSMETPSWRRVSRPASRATVYQESQHVVQPPVHQSPYQAQSQVHAHHSRPPSRYQPEGSPPTSPRDGAHVIQDVPQPQHNIQVAVATTPGVPNLKDIPELTGRENWPAWLQRITAEIRRLGLFDHIADPVACNEMDYLPMDQPTYMPAPITRNADQLVMRQVTKWYQDDHVCLHVVVSRLSPTIFADIPKREENRENRSACARTVLTYLKDHFGGGDVNSIMAAWDRVKVMRAATDQDVAPMISKWEAAYNDMVLIDEKPTVGSVLSALSLALPRSILFMPMVYEYADRVKKNDLRDITTSSVFSDIKSALRLHGNLTDSTTSSKPKSKAPRTDRGSSAASGGAREKEVCGNCKRTGHVEAKCWAPGGTLYGKEAQIQKVLDEKKAARTNRPSAGVAAVNVAPPTATIKEVPDSGGGGSLAGVVFTDLPEYDSHDAYLACVSLSTRPSWLPSHLDHLLDSGCSRHIFNNKDVFWDYKDLPPAPMSTANCGKLDVIGCGTVRLMVVREDGRPFLVNLKDCRYAPSAALNLISVGTWQDAGIAVNFTPHGTICVIAEKRVSFKAEKWDTLSFVGGEVIYPGQEGLIMGAMASAVAPPPLTWHYRLGHLGMDDTRKALSGRWALGVETSGSWPTSVCPPCIIGKGARQPLKKSAHRATTVLELLHVDICGPFPVSSNSGEHPGKHLYWISILDDWSSYGHVRPLPDRSGERLVSVFDQVVTRWERRTGHQVKKIRFDGALELSAGELRKYFVESLGVETQKTAPYAHWQNGKAERRVRTLEDSATAILAGSSLPKSFWAEATLFAQYVRNRSPTSTLPDGITPYERMHGQKPDISNLRVFGCRGYAWIAPEKRRKGDNRREEVIMLGYEQGRKGWWCITPSGRRVFHSDVIWEEDVQGRLSGRPTAERKSGADQGGAEAATTQRRSSRIAALKEASAARVNSKSVVGVCAYLHLDPGIESMVSCELAARVMGDPQRHIEVDSSCDNEHAQEAAEGVFLATRADRHRFVRPRTFNLERAPMSQWEAYQREDRDKWIGGEKTEIDGLWEREVFEKCKLPEGAHAIPVHFVYALKHDGRCKARLVADGNRRRGPIGRTSSPVASISAVRSILAEAATEDLEIMSADVQTAFLWARMSQDVVVYVKQIPKHPDPDGDDIVYRLLRPLYGLQEASFEFYEFLRTTLESIGLHPCPLDRGVFFGVWKISPDPDKVPMPKDGRPLKLTLPFHVDDCLGVTNSRLLWDWYIRELNKSMKVKDLGEVEIHLGMRIFRDRSKRTLWISMTDYIDQILGDEGLGNAKPTPVPFTTQMNKLPEPEKSALPEIATPEQLKATYQRMVGCLCYLTSRARPELAYHATALGQHASNPQRKHLLAAKQVYRYLAGTRDYVLQYPAPTMSNAVAESATAGKIRLETCGLTDADWANDGTDRKSISGYAFYKNNCLVSWRATKQRATACSSTEAETYALCDGMKEGMWLKMFFKSCWMSCPQPFPIFCDNQSTLALIDSDNASSRTKHIDVRYHFIRDQVHSVKAFTTGWLTTLENTADIFTKPLAQPLFEKHRFGLGVVPLPT